MDILDAAGRAGLSPRKMANYRGGEFRCACPACGGDEKSDRFLIWPNYKGGRYRCRHCPVHGDTVQLLVDYCGLTYPQAFEEVGRDMPLDYRPARYRPVGEDRIDNFVPRVCDPPVESWRIQAKKLVDAAHNELLQNKRELDFLAGRGIDHQAVVGFRLGWIDGENGNNCRYRSRKAWGLPSVINEKTGREKALWIPRGIVIPKFQNGSVDRIRIRRPDEDLKIKKDIRYYAMPGSGQGVMGHNPDRQAFVVTEAELDAIMICRHAGSLVGTIGLGSSGIKPDSKAYYTLKKAMRILVSLDFDPAGRNAWSWWRDNFENARLWPVPEGKDPGEAFEKGVDIKAWIEAGLPPALTLETYSGYEIPKGVYPIQELKMLLSKYPVTIEATPEKGRVVFDPGFRNTSIRQRIYDLFHKDDEVHYYLRMHHPDEIITGENCRVVKHA